MNPPVPHRSWLRRTTAAGALAGIAATALVAVAPAPASAETTPEQTATFDLGDLDLSGTGTFDQFDPALGELTSISISAGIEMDFAVCITNLSQGAESLPAGVASGEAPLTFAGGVIAQTTGSMDVPAVDLPAFAGTDGCADWEGAGGDPATDPVGDNSILFSGSDSDTFATTITDPAALAPYIGTGTVDFSYDPDSASTIGQPSEWTIVFLASGSGSARISYTYTPRTPPPRAQPDITTNASRGAVEIPVNADGSTGTVKLFDRITISGFRQGGDAVGSATLYGPVASRSADMCTRATKVGTVRFDPRNGTFRTRSIAVRKPGFYTWVAKTTADSRNRAAGHRCGLRAETTLVNRPNTPPVVIDTGVTKDGSLRTARLSSMTFGYRALDIRATVLTVGANNGRLAVPGNVHRLGWYRRTARPGELIGTTLIAGHVSDNHDRPGAFYRLRNARVGQVVTVAGESYRVVDKVTRSRTQPLPRSIFRTTGRHRLALVSCTGKVTRPDGSFHYTKNLVVVARHVG